MCFLQIQSQCMNPQGPNKAADLDFFFFFFQINIFPKDLNLKHQPQLKSNTTQTFRSSVFTQCVCVSSCCRCKARQVQSVVVYSIAKMFTQPLCLYAASYADKHSESVETSTVFFLEADIAGKTELHQTCRKSNTCSFATKGEKDDTIPYSPH